jgi:polyhydroxyalkanoate synthesis regulator phasin
MQDEIKQILKIVTDEQGLNTARYEELKSDSQRRYDELRNETQQWHDELRKETRQWRDELKDQNQQILKIVTDEQALNAARYHELRKAIDDTNSKMATKEQLDQVYESLSQDITCLSDDHHQLKKRVTVLERKFRKLEDRIS